MYLGVNTQSRRQPKSSFEMNWKQTLDNCCPSFKLATSLCSWMYSHIPAISFQTGDVHCLSTASRTNMWNNLKSQFDHQKTRSYELNGRVRESGGKSLAIFFSQRAPHTVQQCRHKKLSWIVISTSCSRSRLTGSDLVGHNSQAWKIRSPLAYWRQTRRSVCNVLFYWLVCLLKQKHSCY